MEKGRPIGRPFLFEVQSPERSARRCERTRERTAIHETQRATAFADVDIDRTSWVSDGNRLT
jgi:hypothetical protein